MELDMVTSKLFADTPTKVEEPEKGINIYVHVEDELGNRVLSKKSSTLLSNFYAALYSHISSSLAYYRRLDGTIDQVTPSSKTFSVKGASGQTNLGIVVGTSTTPVSMTDFSLGSQIPHGIGAGQLLYGSTDVTDLDFLSNMTRFYVTRLFTNNSGADITVNEVGILAHFYNRYGFTFPALIDRTLATFVVPHGSSRNVIYEIRVVV